MPAVVYPSRDLRVASLGCEAPAPDLRTVALVMEHCGVLQGSGTRRVGSLMLCLGAGLTAAAARWVFRKQRGDARARRRRGGQHVHLRSGGDTLRLGCGQLVVGGEQTHLDRCLADERGIIGHNKEAAEVLVRKLSYQADDEADSHGSDRFPSDRGVLRRTPTSVKCYGRWSRNDNSFRRAPMGTRRRHIEHNKGYLVRAAYNGFSDDDDGGYQADNDVETGYKIAALCKDQKATERYGLQHWKPIVKYKCAI